MFVSYTYVYYVFVYFVLYMYNCMHERTIKYLVSKLDDEIIYMFLEGNSLNMQSVGP